MTTPKPRQGSRRLFSGELSGSSHSPKGMLIIFIVLMSVITHLLSGSFFASYTMTTFIRQATFTILMGLAQMLVLLVGGLDLSVASMALLSSTIFALLLKELHLPLIICILLGILAGWLMGFINGLFVSRLRLPSFIVTLSTSYLYKGISFVATGGAPIANLPASAVRIGSGTVLRFIPYPTIITCVVALLLSYMLNFTGQGRRFYAVGGNERAASIVGIPSGRTKIAAYSLCGVICAISGILTAMRLGSAQLSIGASWVMPSITAAVLGGTSMKGGTGNVSGVVLGGVFLTIIGFGFSVLGMASYWTEIFTGAIVLATISFDAIKSRIVYNNKEEQ